MNIKEKLIQYLEIKGVSQRKFSIDTGLSEGILRRGAGINADKLLIIKTKFPDLNINWLLFDEGEMLLSTVAVQPESVKEGLNKCERRLIELQEKLIVAQEQVIALQEELRGQSEKKEVEKG